MTSMWFTMLPLPTWYRNPTNGVLDLRVNGPMIGWCEGWRDDFIRGRQRKWDGQTDGGWDGVL